MIPASNEEHVPAASCPPVQLQTPQSAHSTARQVDSGRIVRLQALLLMLIGMIMTLAEAQSDLQHHHPHHRPCSSMAGKLVVGCAAVTSSASSLPASSSASVSSSSSQSSPASGSFDSLPLALSASSSGYVANAHYRFTPGELANRKYAQLKLHNQQLIQRLQTQTNLTNPSSASASSSMLANSLENPTDDPTKLSSFSSSAPNNTQKQADTRIFEDIYGVQGRRIAWGEGGDQEIEKESAIVHSFHIHFTEGLDKKDKDERVHQMNVWLSDESALQADSSSQIEVRARPPTLAGNYPNRMDSARAHTHTQEKMNFNFIFNQESGSDQTFDQCWIEHIEMVTNWARPKAKHKKIMRIMKRIKTRMGRPMQMRSDPALARLPRVQIPVVFTARIKKIIRSRWSLRYAINNLFAIRLNWNQ